MIPFVFYHNSCLKNTKIQTGIRKKNVHNSNTAKKLLAIQNYIALILNQKLSIKSTPISTFFDITDVSRIITGVRSV